MLSAVSFACRMRLSARIALTRCIDSDMSCSTFALHKLAQLLHIDTTKYVFCVQAGSNVLVLSKHHHPQMRRRSGVMIVGGADSRLRNDHICIRGTSFELRHYFLLDGRSGNKIRRGCEESVALSACNNRRCALNDVLGCREEEEG